MSSPQTPRTILLAEDEADLRQLVSSVLTRSGYNVIVACNAEEALLKARQYDGPIDLLLSNFQMPGISGSELARRIHSERPHTRIMLMSGYSSGLLVLDAGWRFLPKPFLPAALLKAIDDLLRTRPAALLSSEG